MSQPLKKYKLNYNESKNIYVKNEGSMSVHNISMNAILCSSLNLDCIYKHFSNCIYNPREFKCMRIDVPVSLNTVNKYKTYVQNKKKIKLENKDVKTDNYICLKGDSPTINEINTNVVTNEGLRVNNNNSSSSSISSSRKNNVTDGLVSSVGDVPIVTDFSTNVNLVSATNITPVTDIDNFDNVSNLSCNLSNINTSGITSDNIDLFNENSFSLIGETTTNLNNINNKLIINVSLFSNGKIICTGNNSIEACKIAMKKIEKKLKELNYKNIKLKKIAITNILAVYNVGFSIVLPLFALYYKSVDYDPNVFPACKVKIAMTSGDDKNSFEKKKSDNNYAWCNVPNVKQPEKNKVDIVSASIFSTGNITLTGGKSYENLQNCINILLPYLIKSKSQH
ncbi:transcription initiation TFIID-like, putative [Hepatocystis sp. ex Piliocolobus tephrosceles]|nr:transcription initiation TFIID-like, putative [Hepatocystis sp. ex Piliocolobus tephrosceles]